MNFAVIGLGSFGVKRAKAIKSSKMAKLVCIFDPDEGNASSAPIKTNLKIKVFLSTLITLPLTYLVVSIVENGFINILIDRFNI